jgi:predicted nucleic acid-binding protein
MHGKKNEPLIIVDADAIVSFTDVGDQNHTKAKQIMQQLATKPSAFLFPTTALCEAVTVLRSKLNKPDDAEGIVQKFQSGAFPLHAVDGELLLQAMKLFQPHGSKKNTLFDAVIAALATKLYAEAIFSCDEWYRKQGFTLAEDLLTAGKQAA